MELDFSLSELRAIAESAADQIGRAHNNHETVRFVKEDGSWGTDIEKRISLELQTTLTSIQPNSAWLSEEDHDNLERLQHDFVWIVDPIDGTRDFVQGTNEFALSIGLSYRGTAVAGAIINPATGEGGVCANGELEFFGFNGAPVSKSISLEQAKICISKTEYRRGLFNAILPLAKQIHPMGSVAYKLLRIAAGADHLFITRVPKNEWDICGGFALLRASDHDVWTFDQSEIKFNKPITTITSGFASGHSDVLKKYREQYHNLL